MTTKYKLTAIMVLGLSTMCFAQGRTPDFQFKLRNTNYFMMLSNGNAKAKNDTVFYNLYRVGKTQRIAKEIKQVIDRNTGNLIKSGSFDALENQLFFFLKDSNNETTLHLYTQNGKGLLSVKTIVGKAVAPFLRPTPIEPLPPHDGTGYPGQVDIPAEFPGGINKARQFIANNIQYPDEAVENGVNGTVQAKFTIEADGSISNIQIVRKLGYGCDEEVVRVLKRMPKWTPAKLKGQNVRSYFTMPISFRTTD